MNKVNNSYRSQALNHNSLVPPPQKLLTLNQQIQETASFKPTHTQKNLDNQT